MNEDELDFEGNAQTGGAGNAGGQQGNNEDVTNLHGDDVDDLNKKGGEDEGDKGGSQNNDNHDDDANDLEEGTNIEYDGNTYTVDKDGNIVDDKGNIFKEAKDVKDWLKSVNVEDSEKEDENKGLDIASIQKALGQEITDENGKLVEFTNDAAGVKAYVEEVINLRSQELQEAAINKLYADKPILRQFEDYLAVNGGDPRGFGQLPDRSGIQLDKDNPDQLEAIIRMAAKEFGNKSLNDNYIKYLKDSGALYDTAKEQLDALVEKDKSIRERIANEAKAAREQEAKEVQEYWANVNNKIVNRNIDGYKLPESFIKVVNGQKMTLTPDDFYNYLYKPVHRTEDGRVLTGYQKALNDQSDDAALNSELIQAWLLFTGGTYKDLIDMAVKEEQVRTLRVKSKEQRTARTIKISKPKEKFDVNNIVL